MKKILIILMFVFLVLTISVNAESDFLEVNDYLVDYSYEIPEAGDRFTLTVTVTNEDNIAREDIKFELNLDDPFDNVGDDDWNIGILEPDESVTKNFRLEVDDNAVNDDYEMEFEITDNLDNYDDYFSIEVESVEPELIIGDIRSDPMTIVADKEDIKLMIDIQNIGDGDAKFVRARLNLPNGFTSSNSFSDISNLGTINQGETKEAVFYIDTSENLNLNLYSANVELEYKDNNDNSKKDVLLFSLPVKGIPQFSIVNLETNPLSISQGDVVSLRIDLKNIGSEEARETSVKVFEKTDYPFSFTEKTNFVGNIQSGKIGTALFNFEVDNDAEPKTYLVNIQIRTVSQDNVLITDETIPITINANQKDNSNSIMLFGIIILIIVIVLALVLIFKRR